MIKINYLICKNVGSYPPEIREKEIAYY